MISRRVVRVVIATISAVLLLGFGASSASAATTFGADLTTLQVNTFSCDIAGGCTYSQGSPSYTSPASGVVVRWRTRGSSGPLTLRIITGNTGGVGSSTVSPPTNGVEAFATRLPISAGDRIGVDLPPGFVSNVGVRTPAGHSVDGWFPALAVGESRAPGPYSNYELLLNADVELDADHDGYGDESQDLCPTSAATQGPCPTSPATVPRRKKCKKHKKRHAAAVAKKCKKKHRK